LFPGPSLDFEKPEQICHVITAATKMAFCSLPVSRRGVFIFLILGLSFVHCSKNDCEAFDDDDDVQLEKCEVTFEAEDLKESINCGQFVPLQEFKDTFDGTAPTVKYSNAVRIYN